MRILHVLPSINPVGGGPMEGVRQYGTRAAKIDQAIEVLTLDSPDEPFVGEYPLKVWALGPSKTGYRYNSRLRGWLREHAREYDAVVINGLWQYHGFGAWRALHKLDVPYYVFCHGMLDPWFKRTYPLKHLKKWLYWPWAEYRLLRDARAVFFTCEEERRLAPQSFWLYKANAMVVNYGTSEPPQDREALREVFFGAHPDLRGKRLLLFLSRIHEKKGCDLLVEAFARVASTDPKLHLVMAGPDQTGLVAGLKAQAQRLGVADRITWPGMLTGDMKWGAFYAAETFVLPSHQENFGIAVAEALGCGLPVLISNQVNIWQEIKQDGAGLVEPDTVNGTTALLSRWLQMSDADRAAMAAQARATFVARFHIDAMVHSLISAIERTKEVRS